MASVDTREKLHKHFGALDGKSLKEIANYLNLIPEQLEAPFDWHRVDEEFLRELLVSICKFLKNRRDKNSNFLLIIDIKT